MRPILFHLPLPHFNLPITWIPLFFAFLFALVVLHKLLSKKKNYKEASLAGAFMALCLFIRFTILRENTTTVDLANFPIYSYGAMLLLSFILGWFLTLGLATRDGLPKRIMANNYIFTAVAAIIGARLLYVLTNLQQFNTFSSLFSSSSGLVAYGGFLGGLAGSILFLRYYKLPLLPWGDVVVPSLASGLMITRIGCYLFGCDFGLPLSENSPAILRKLGSFPHWPAEFALGRGAPAWLQHVQQRGLPMSATYSLPVHPTQLYESLAGAGLLILLLVARKYQRFSGQVFFLFIFTYGMARYILEIVRDDAARGSLLPSLPEHVLHPLALVFFAIVFVVGISKAITNRNIRRIIQIVVFIPVIVVLLILAPENSTAAVYVQLSTSQFIALLSALASGVAFKIEDSRARTKSILSSEKDRIDAHSF
ncbi:MAG: prolipoprotein diacylglyceryl transferase [Bdellovibrio sp.]|nr:prolipoprotein diacylglyceryl transferase [Bdellovibrio sp.]